MQFAPDDPGGKGIDAQCRQNFIRTTRGTLARGQPHEEPDLTLVIRRVEVQIDNEGAKVVCFSAALAKMAAALQQGSDVPGELNCVNRVKEEDIKIGGGHPGLHGGTAQVNLLDGCELDAWRQGGQERCFDTVQRKIGVEPEIENFLIGEHAKGQWTGLLQARLGVKTLAVCQRQSSPAQSAFPDGLHVEVAGVAECLGFCVC